MMEHFAEEIAKVFSSIPQSYENLDNFDESSQNVPAFVFQYNQSLYSISDIYKCLKIMLKNEIQTVAANKSVVEWISKKFDWVQLQFNFIIKESKQNLFGKLKSLILQLPEILYEPFESTIYHFVKLRKLFLPFIKNGLFSFDILLSKAFELDELEINIRNKIQLYIECINSLDDDQIKCLYEIYFNDYDITNKLDCFSHFLSDKLKNSTLSHETKIEIYTKLDTCFFYSNKLKKLLNYIQEINIEAKDDENFKIITERLDYILINYIRNIYAYYDVENTDFIEDKNFNINLDFHPELIKIKFFALDLFFKLNKKGDNKNSKEYVEENLVLFKLSDILIKNNKDLFYLYNLTAETINNFGVFLDNLVNEKDNEIAIEMTKNYLTKTKISFVEYLPFFEWFIDYLETFFCDANLTDDIFKKINSKFIDCLTKYRQFRNIYLGIKHNDQIKK